MKFMEDHRSMKNMQLEADCQGLDGTLIEFQVTKSFQETFCDVKIKY